MTNPSGKDKKQQEAEKILQRINQQQVGDEFRQPVDSTNDDNIEKWAKIVGRSLGFMFLAYLIYSLYTTYIA